MSKKALNIEIGNHIRIARETAKMTQEELAEKINRSTQFISTIERGVAGPSLETIVNLCEVLNVSCEWILCGRHSLPTAASIAAKLNDLSDEQLLIVNQLVDDLLTLIKATKHNISCQEK